MRDEKTNYNYNKLISYVPKEKINIVISRLCENGIIHTNIYEK